MTDWVVVRLSRRLLDEQVNRELAEKGWIAEEVNVDEWLDAPGEQRLVVEHPEYEGPYCNVRVWSPEW